MSRKQPSGISGRLGKTGVKMANLMVEAWIPVTALVKATLEIDEEEWMQLTHDEKIERMRTDGETDAHICDDCSEFVKLDEGMLTQEDPESIPIEFVILD